MAGVIGSDTTHIIVDPSSTARLAALKAHNRRRRKLLHVGSSAWVEACIARGCLCDEAAFRL